MARNKGKSKAKKVSKFKFKWTKEFIILLSALTIIIVAAILLSIPRGVDKFYDKIYAAQEENSISNYLDDEHVFKELNHKKMLAQIEKDEYTYVYYGSTSNTTFLNYVQKVNQTAKDYEVDRVYYYSSEWYEDLDLTTEDTKVENKRILKEREDSLKGIDLSFIPGMFVYKNGELLFDSIIYTDDKYTPSGDAMSLAITKAFSKFYVNTDK
ncbi:MAG: hypothetical protein ACRC5M_01600 [Anaeroplasmataceae bacterium]